MATGHRKTKDKHFTFNFSMILPATCRVKLNHNCGRGLNYENSELLISALDLRSWSPVH